MGRLKQQEWVRAMRHPDRQRSQCQPESLGSNNVCFVGHPPRYKAEKRLLDGNTFSGLGQQTGKEVSSKPSEVSLSTGSNPFPENGAHSFTIVEIKR